MFNKLDGFHQQKGFTLIEVLTVMLVLVAVASVTVQTASTLAFQGRDEITKDRYAKIKAAILGNPNIVVNGQPDISGFVGDMGRLPTCLRELIENYNCTTGISNALWATAGAPSNLKVGWRGPYLSIPGNPAKPNAFTDGWGRLAQGYCNPPTADPYTVLNPILCGTGLPPDWTTSTNDFNYGWYFNSLSANTLTIMSYGKDQIYNGFDYDTDYPAPASQPSIKADDWRVNISNGISVQFQSPLFSGVCRQDNVSRNTCYGNAAHWENCLFLTASKCATTGGSWGTDCRMTQTACTNKGGTWSVSGNPQCVFDATSCPTAGGVWSVSESLCVFTPGTCLTAGGAATQTCLFNSTTCLGAGKTWTASTNSCSFTLGQCSADGGIYTTSGSNASCLRTYKTPSSSTEQYTETSCLADGFGWYGGSRSISVCMKIYYRQDGVVSSPPSISTNHIVIEENNMVRQLYFISFIPTDISAGINAVGIYEYDTATSTCTDTIYPSDRQGTIPVLFNRRSNLPVINW